MTPPRRAWGRLWALGLGLTLAGVALGALELRWRRQELGGAVVVTDPAGLKYALAEDLPVDEGRGWREGRVPTAPSPGRVRVICVGDSLSFGVHVSPRESWPGVLRSYLGDERAEVLNFGMTGYDAEQVATLVEARLAAWAPDVLVWGTYTNDPSPTYILYGRDTLDPVYVGTSIPQGERLLPEAPSLWLVRHSAIFRGFQGAAHARLVAEQGFPEAPEGWYEGWLDRVIAWTRARGVRLVVLALAPHVMAGDQCEQLFPNPAHCSLHARRYAEITAALDARGVSWADGLGALRAAGQPSFYPPGVPDPDHPNADGYRLLARAVYPLVADAVGEVRGGR